MEPRRSMQSPQLPLSCIPCAKRKVRCDRIQPCSHCRRRRGDICNYPVPIDTILSNSRRPTLDTTQIERLERLEEYIRRLGHDPDQVDQSLKSKPTESRNSEHSRLVEHDQQTTYIEAPLWYSWSEAQRPAIETLDRLPERHHLGYRGTLLDPIDTTDATSLQSRHPPGREIVELWNRFLSNVHPLTKLFFDWEKGLVLQKAADSPHTLSTAEHAFSFAVYFITILSLSDKECAEVLGDSGKAQLLDDFQSSVETALLVTGFMATSDLLVLQAFLLYLIAMRNRARPAALFSLMGIAVRIAQRMGLHRDGSLLGVPVVQAEERRRVWWCMQHMEILVSQILGCISLTLYADWDTKMPANLDDDDIRSGIDDLPPNRRGLTSMSQCLWRHRVLYKQRTSRDSDHPPHDFAWVASLRVSRAKKDAFIDSFSRSLSEEFILHCELLNPLHVYIQIGIRAFILALKRIAYQPKVENTKISEMSKEDRNELLEISVECLEYYFLEETTPSIAHFRWHNEYYFQWTAFVYVIIEAHHRATTPEAFSLWTIIDKVCSVHSKFKAPPERPDIVAIGRLIVLAWHPRQEHLQQLQDKVEKPSCVAKLEDELELFMIGTSAKASDGDLGWDTNNFMDLDLDVIDWSAWERDGYVQALN